jgi:hypothetical protein
MFFFIEAVADIVSAYFPLEDQPGAALIDDGWATRLFPALLLCLLGLEDYPPVVTDSRTAERKELAKQMRELATFFVAAHEYAHVILGHHKESVQGGPRDLPAEIPLRQVQETEADQWGLILTLAYADQRGWNLALGYWAADYYFGAYQFIEQFVAEVVRPIEKVLFASAARQGFMFRIPHRVRGHIRPWVLRQFMEKVIRPTKKVLGFGSESHPPTEGRRWMLRQFMETMPGNVKGSPSVINRALEQAARTDGFIVAVWRRSSNEFADQLSAKIKK